MYLNATLLQLPSFFKYVVNLLQVCCQLSKDIHSVKAKKKNTPTFYRRLSNPTVSREVFGRGVRSLLFRGVRKISFRFVGVQLFLFLLNSSGSHFPHLEQKTAVMTQIDPINRTALTTSLSPISQKFCVLLLSISSPFLSTIACCLASRDRHKAQHEIARLPNA